MFFSSWNNEILINFFLVNEDIYYRYKCNTKHEIDFIGGVSWSTTNKPPFCVTMGRILHLLLARYKNMFDNLEAFSFLTYAVAEHIILGKTLRIKFFQIPEAGSIN